MKELLKVISALLIGCLGLGVAVGELEEKHGKKGWVDGHKPYGYYERKAKRPLDFGLSLFALLFLWPVMLVTAFLVRVKLGKPVLFRQERPGLGGQIFTIRKYRTMLDGEGSDEERLTNFGKKLRSVSVDELPELINILEGSMSFVGPRPLMPGYLPYFTEQERHRHDVRPGLTGLAQVHGRNNLSWEERFEFDIQYADDINFINDVKIIIKTIKKVVKEEDVVVRGTEKSVLDFDMYRRMKNNYEEEYNA